MCASNNDQANASGQIICAAEGAASASALLVVATTLLWQFRHYFPMPVYDEIQDRVRYYDSLASAGSLLRYLISGHNEHRILTSRLIFITNEIAFHGREYTLFIVTNLLQLLSAYLVYRFAFRPELEKSQLSTRLLVAAVIALLFVNPNYFYTLIVPFQVQHAIMTLLVIVTAILVAQAKPSKMSARGQAALVGGLLALAIVATFTLANAPVILIAAAAASIVLRWPPKLCSLLVVLATIHSIIVIETTIFVGETSANLLQLLKFALVYWGSPLLRAGPPWPSPFATWPTWPHLAGLFGVGILGITSGFGLLRLVKPGSGGRVATFGFTVLVAVVVTGIAAAHSRLQFGVLEGGNKKYASFAALGWVGGLAVLTGLAIDCRRVLGRPISLVFALVLITILPLSIFGYSRETRPWEKVIDRTWEGGLALLLKVNDATSLKNIDSDLPELRRYVDYIEPKNRGIFSELPARWGDNAERLLGERAPTTCRSGVEKLDPVPAADLTTIFDAPGTPMIVSGWTWMTDDHSPPATIMAVDGQHRIVGLARMTRRSPSAEELLGQKFDENLGWFGFARLTEPTTVSFFALSTDDKHFCALGTIGSIQ